MVIIRVFKISVNLTTCPILNVKLQLTFTYRSYKEQTVRIVSSEIEFYHFLLNPEVLEVQVELSMALWLVPKLERTGLQGVIRNFLAAFRLSRQTRGQRGRQRISRGVLAHSWTVTTDVRVLECHGVVEFQDFAAVANSISL